MKPFICVSGIPRLGRRVGLVMQPGWQGWGAVRFSCLWEARAGPYKQKTCPVTSLEAWNKHANISAVTSVLQFSLQPEVPLLQGEQTACRGGKAKQTSSVSPKPRGVFPLPPSPNSQEVVEAKGSPHTLRQPRPGARRAPGPRLQGPQLRFLGSDSRNSVTVMGR